MPGITFQSIEPNDCRLALSLTSARHGNSFGNVHGGVYASLLDTAAYWAAYCQMDEAVGYTSLDLSVTNLAMVRTGQLITKGHVIRQGRSICLSEATITDPTGKLLAHGTSKLMVLTGKQSPQDLTNEGDIPPLPPKFLAPTTTIHEVSNHA